MIRKFTLSIILGVLCCPVESSTNETLISNITTATIPIANSTSEGLRYTAYRKSELESFRRPDRKAYSVIIQDRQKNLNYSLGDGEILAFIEAHTNGVYSFAKDDAVFYVSSPEIEPLKIENGDGLMYGRDFDMFNQAGAMWFSPSDKYLAYTSRPANLSQKMMMTTFERGNVYDYNYNMAYLKTGESVSANVSISIWSKEANNSITVHAPLKDNSSFHYLFSVSWVLLHGKELLMTTWANRWQNETLLSLCDYEQAKCSTIYEHIYEHGQWASEADYDNMKHSNDSIFFLLPKAIGNNSWQHIAKIEITMDHKIKSISFVPSGEYDIQRIVGYRSKEDLLIYEAQAPHPWNTHAYGAPAGERSIIEEDRCLTCVFANCTYQNQTQISKSEELNIYFHCSGTGQPFDAAITFNATIHPKEIEIISDAKANDYAPEWKIEKFKLANGFEAIVRIYEGNTTLDSVPVTLYVYGGPNSNLVADKYYNLSNVERAIVHIDVRGSGGRGWNYRSAIYGRLLTVEVEDTIEAMQMVLNKYARFDKSRVGVKGWSYGGAMTAALVEHAPDGFFKCAYVGAPVTNFIYYYAQYTERYMGDAPLPTYTDLTLNVTKFKHTNLLLVHGMRDDNVHFQNSALLIEALQQENIQFELMVYPNLDHQVNNNHSRELTKNFFSTCFS